ncbi:hypothetical protein [Microvirga lotononidis]|uniref:Uncharacterized protein n=1 Tax=Microvirga lotononidis TaxID=864069 RepID=I4YQF1_9HYPH|nr:hypothetical protein [Microvirga lotononidis]EIM26193.1 hypothetical protein MicloDRAFT_00051510 [Microvirga lotononidis]WQO31500.1 hypothetical protein U0023_35060 [Microvirga lotononidis]
MPTDTVLSLEASLPKTGDQITDQADGLTILIKRQDEGVSVYTYGAGQEAFKEDWTLFTEGQTDASSYEAAAQAAGWSLLSAQDDHDEAFVLQVEGQDDRIERYGGWEELCLSEGIEVTPAPAKPEAGPTPATAPSADWSALPDLHQAEKEGWRISECNEETETARLERDDGMGVFAGDAEAWTHVFSKAQGGSPYHQSILNWLRDNAPVEFQRISVHQEAQQDKTTWAIVNDAGEFWSNDDGWVDQESKTLFYAHEKLTVNLPMGGQWALVG